MNLPWHHLVAYAHRCMFLHVIARSEATWQSVLLAAVHNEEQYLRRIRKSAYEFARSSTKLPGFPAGTRIAAPVCALVRNDRFGRYVRTRARVQCTTFLPGDADCRTSALQPQTRCRLQHVIARSEATWQSVLPAAVHNEEQYLGRIRKVSRIRPKYCQPAKFPCGDADCRTSVRTGSQ